MPAEKFVGAALRWPSSVTAKAFPDIYQYWIAKRQKLHKPLCRKYWPATAASDTNPLLVFRPREKERYKLRKHRRNDLSSFRKLQSIRREFAKARVLLQLIHERELLKKVTWNYTLRICYTYFRLNLTCRRKFLSK